MTNQTSAYDRLVAALAENFTDTQLHSFIIAAEHLNHCGLPNWELLRRAAIDAADCTDCHAPRRRRETASRLPGWPDPDARPRY